MPLSLTLDEDMDVLAFPTKWLKQRPDIMIDGLQQTSLKIELQFRGSLHFHCIVWLKNAPEFDPQDPESYEKCEECIDSFVTCKKDETLGELMNLQFHRFNYPLPPMRKNKILLPLSNDMDEQEKLTARKLWSEIKEQTEIIAKNHEDCSFDEYLAYLNLDEQSYIQALRSKLKRPTVFLGRNLNERRVNAYNKEMLILWEAHMDIQLVVSPYGCVKYIVSYVSKSQKGMSKLLKEVADKVAKGDEPTIEKLRKIVNAFLNNCEISAQEIALHSIALHGIPMSKSSIGTIYINSCPPDQRVFLKKGKKENYKEGEDKLNFQRENLMLFTSWRTEPSLLDSDLPTKFGEKLEVIQTNRSNYCKYDSVFDNIEVDLLEEDEENEEESTIAPQFKILDLNETPSDFQLEIPHTEKFQMASPMVLPAY
ncbi:tRNA (guanine-N(7)-)-methyltransferase [Frankliniella fusca]|uniref:tRNA (Guanine-N(7)-)-methyltransferase n=1 Tax=Frankliniella fusca TaxID=407009 RepID=A0AAE1HWT6_9NEOP|nr:tRNA (guanine-N(7)-)-methyltransferase [Frankliniella fusca]